MRKQTKLVAVLSAAALLAIGASMTSFAKAGWALDGDEWVWLDSNGDRVSNEWKKSADGNYYWLDDEGLIAENSVIDDDDETYYVNEYGIRVKNAWISIDNEDDLEINGETPEELWFYFGANGRAIKNDNNDSREWKKQNIEWSQGTDTFFFNEDGHMVTGWVDYDGEVYYCGETGNAHKGWWDLEVRDSLDDGTYEDIERFNFKDSGKMRRAKTGEASITWYSNGQYYAFDENGVLQNEWYDTYIATGGKVTDNMASNGVVIDSGYAGEYPAAGTGWVYSLDPTEDDYYWYYLVSFNDGKSVKRNVPFNKLAVDGLMRAKQVKGKTYLFDADGKMKDGLQTITAANTYVAGEDWAGGALSRKIDPGIYYFRKDGATTKGQVITGKTAVTDDGETNYYYFDSKRGGAALVNMVKAGIVYGTDGRRMDADDGNANQIREIDEP
jgi:glucan-binding YG repeat protein